MFGFSIFDFPWHILKRGSLRKERARIKILADLKEVSDTLKARPAIKYSEHDMGEKDAKHICESFKRNKTQPLERVTLKDTGHFRGKPMIGVQDKIHPAIKNSERNIEEIVAHCDWGRVSNKYLLPFIDERISPPVIPYQCCPVCNGTGQIEAYTTKIPCRCCNGEMIIPMHIVSAVNVEHKENEPLEKEMD